MKYVTAAITLFVLALLSSCRSSPQKLIATADKFHANKKYKEAEILYQKVIVKDKKNADAYYKGGLNFLDEGKPREAAEYLRRAIDLQPSNTAAEIKLADLYLAAYVSNPDRLKQLRPDIDDLRHKILQHDPNSFEAMRIEAVLDLIDRKPDDALQVLSKANGLHPYSRDLIGLYAQTLVKTGHQDQAEALVKDMLAHDKTWAPGYDFLFLLYRQQQDAAKQEAILREHLNNDPHSAKAITELAAFLAAANRPDEAERTMKLVLADPKTFPQDHEMLGDFYTRSRKFDQAIDQYKQAAVTDPAHSLADQERIVMVDQMAGKSNEALSLAKSLADKNPKDAGAVETYASLLTRVGLPQNLSKSTAELVTLTKNNPTNPVLHLELARAYLTGNNVDKALSEALDAMQGEAKRPSPRPAVIIPSRLIAARMYGVKGQAAQTLEQANQVLAVQPSNPEARLLKDQALIAVNQGNQATDDLLALVKQFPQLGEARLALAKIYMSQRQFDQATEQYDAIWTGKPPDLRGYIGLQTVKFAQGKTDEAVRGMSDLLAKDPANPSIRFELMQIQTAAGERTAATNPTAAKSYIDQAATNAKELLKISPNDVGLWIRLGELQQLLGQSDAALASYEQASHIDGKNSGALVRRAVLLEATGRKKEAMDLYNQALGLDPNNPLALNNLAFLNAQQGTNLDQAMSYAEHAKQEAPKDPNVADTLGFVYMQKNLNAQALEIFRQDVQDQPLNPTFHLHLAMALLKKGDKQGARDEAQKALKTAPPSQQAEIRNFVGQIG